jgi:SPRY domain
VSYEKLVELITAAVGYDFNTKALKLTYQDFDNDTVVVSSTRELTYAIRQVYDAGTIKFVGNVQQGETLIKPVSHHVPGITEGAAAIPKDLIVEYPSTRFDCAKASCFTLDEDNRRVTRTANIVGWNFIYLKNGITSGRKYWSFKIIHKGNDTMIGVCDSSLNLAQISTYPGASGVSGCSLNLTDGYLSYCNKYVACTNASRAKGAAVIGVLVDMNHKTVTFYADGERVGTVEAGSNVLMSGREYFPVVSLYSHGSCVEVMDLVPSPTLH